MPPTLCYTETDEASNCWSRKHLLNKIRINDNQTELFDGQFSPSCREPSKSLSQHQPISYQRKGAYRSRIQAPAQLPFTTAAPWGGFAVCWCMKSLIQTFCSLKCSKVRAQILFQHPTNLDFHPQHHHAVPCWKSNFSLKKRKSTICNTKNCQASIRRQPLWNPTAVHSFKCVNYVCFRKLLQEYSTPTHTLKENCIFFPTFSSCNFKPSGVL